MSVKMQLPPRAMWALHLWHLMGILLFFSCLLLQLHAFNLDAENPIIYTGPEGSYFGFSVEFYMPESGTPGVLIGAPKANTTQENVIEGGAVFLCPWSTNGSLCSLIPFDTKAKLHNYLQAYTFNAAKFPKIIQDKFDIDYIWKYWTRVLDLRVSYEMKKIHIRDPGTIHTILNVRTCPSEASKSKHACRLLYENQNTTGDRYSENSKEIMMDYKSNQWFGATVKAYKEKVVACAPMYHWKYVKISFNEDLTGGKTPVGSCLVASQNFSTYAEYSPCRSSILQAQIEGGAPDQRFCEAGWSSELTEGGDLLFGAPGSFFWQGQLIAAKVDQILQNYDYNSPLKVLGSKKQTEDAKGTQDNSFMGYSLALGEFTGDSVKEYLVGAPRAKSTLGSVIILWSTNMTTIQSIIGEQVAAYFGYAVTVLDINSDGRDDILVGAPLFMSRGQDGKLHELGRLYVYLQEKPGVFKEPPQTFTGTDKYGRFGSAITSLGDLDYDGYMDVAVGAPFAGEDGNGRVFIYLGHATGLYQEPFQELKGTWNPDVMSAGFGFALKGGSDIDANNFPDLIVGAHDVDNVLVYRAKPVVTAEVKLALVPNILNPELKTCRLPETHTSVTCFEVQMCARVKGHDIPQHYVLDAQVQLDKNKQRSQQRTLFLHSHQAQEWFQFPPMENKQETCKNLTAYLRDEAEFKDKLSLIVVTLNCSLAEASLTSSGTLSMVLSPHSQVLVTQKARILLDCGSDNVCTPNLKLSAIADKDHLIAGEVTPLTVSFSAVNDGEGAYETELHIPLPPQIYFTSVVQGNKGLTKLSCNLMVNNGSQTVICDLGNPMESDTKISAGLHFTVHSLEQVETITISMQIKSKNSQNSDSEVVHLKLRVKAVAQLVLRGASLPEQIFLPFINLESPSDTVVKNNSLPVIEHVFELHNNGPSTISKALIEIDWPADFNGDGLLFKSKLVPWGEIKCTVNSSDAVNWVEPLSTMRPYTTGNRRHEMNKRDVSKPETLMEETILDLTCNTSVCVKILCHVGRLERKKGAVISIQSSLRVEPFIKNLHKQYTFQSKALFNVQEMPYKVQPEEFSSGNTVVKTVIDRSEHEDARNVPVWCIIVAVVGGLLLVALVAFLLWKCGFFKRKLPPTESEELL